MLDAAGRVPKNRQGCASGGSVSFRKSVSCLGKDLHVVAWIIHPGSIVLAKQDKALGPRSLTLRGERRLQVRSRLGPT